MIGDEVSEEKPLLVGKLAELYSYWQGLPCGDVALPTWKSFDPIDVPKLLPILILTRIERENLNDYGDPRWLIRLIGTELVQIWGQDVSGYYIDQILPGDHYHYMYSHYKAVVQEKRPLYLSYLTRQEGGLYANIARVFLPFTSQGENGEVTDILVGQLFRYDNSRLMRPVSDELESLQLTELHKEFL